MNRWYRNIAGKLYVLASPPAAPGPEPTRVALVLEGPGASAAKEGRAVRLKMLVAGVEIDADVDSLEREATKREADAAIGLTPGL